MAAGTAWPRPAKILAYAATAAGAAGAVVLAADCAHAYRVLRARRDAEEAWVDNHDTVTLSPELKEAYGPNARTVTAEDMKAAQEHGQKELDEIERKGGPFADPDLVSVFKIQRESALFVGGGRAALLQLAHPFIAVGIAQHSDLASNGVQARFHNTFKYLFAMMFGEEKASMRASRTVRAMHNRVKGTITEPVGIFQEGDTFDAGNAHAMLWVYMTLIDTTVFAYELMVRQLSTREKDALVEQSNRFMHRMFGVPRSLAFRDYNDFSLKMLEVMHSPILGVGPTAKNVDNFLWTPPARRFAPIMSYVRWFSFVMLPRDLAAKFYGRAHSRMDEILWAFSMGVHRFIYRLLPSCMRWLSAYLAFEERHGIKRTRLEKLQARLAAHIANSGLASLMPPRENKQLAAEATG